ncbi:MULTISPECIES: hypothetical protein [Myroides]|uniref:DUF3899 domain-containing protein n=1 Tax=Myroides odoratimimus CCUG 10230 TaxID=883150 RepID=A0ABN0E855_9FLAO|nr:MULTISPECIES: hypothetical protein [Myroides]EHO07749.1 hypothetical protein HMPREF9712_02485 [Myroides odoratimimus CCUG 10230]MDM1373655.1 hypothetical protein [Myroides marinus]
MNVNFYKDLHTRELTRKKELDDSLNMPITILSLLIALNGILIKEYLSFISNNWVFYLFFTGVLVICGAIFFLIKSMGSLFVNLDYNYFGYPNEILDFENKLNDYNKEVKKSERVNVENEFKKEFVRISTSNKKINDKRADNLHYCRSCLVIAVSISVALLICLLIKTL